MQHFSYANTAAFIFYDAVFEGVSPCQYYTQLLHGELTKG